MADTTQTFLNIAPTASGLLDMRHGRVSTAPQRLEDIAGCLRQVANY
jgi:hypothetical protein